MNRKITYLTAFVCIAAASTMLYSCNNDNGKSSETDSTVTSFDSVSTNTFYLIPSPEDLFALSGDKHVKYQPLWLNPVDNIDKYIDTRDKEFNFGVYAADLAYSSYFGNYSQSVKYLNIIRSLSDDIGIGGVFTQGLVSRIDNVMNNSDSLKSVASATYNDIMYFLNEKKRNKTMALISAGGWVEAIFIVCNSIDKYQSSDPTVQLLADQKIVFENLLNYFDQIGDTRSISELAPVKAVYDNLKTKKAPEDKNQSQEGKIVIGGNVTIVMTESDFNNLKKSISEVRNKMTSNNVSH